MFVVDTTDHMVRLFTTAASPTGHPTLRRARSATRDTTTASSPSPTAWRPTPVDASTSPTGEQPHRGVGLLMPTRARIPQEWPDGGTTTTSLQRTVPVHRTQLEYTNSQPRLERDHEKGQESAEAAASWRPPPPRCSWGRCRRTPTTVPTCQPPRMRRPPASTSRMPARGVAPRATGPTRLKSAYLLNATSEESLCYSCHGDGGTVQRRTSRAASDTTPRPGRRTRTEDHADRQPWHHWSAPFAAAASRRPHSARSGDQGDLLQRRTRNSYSSNNQLIPPLATPAGHHVQPPRWRAGSCGATAPSPGRRTPARR